MVEDVDSLIKISTLATIAFVVAFAATPLLSHFLYKYKLGKGIREGKTPIFTKLHKKKEGTPTMGGILVWGTVLIMAAVFGLLSHFTDIALFDQLNFLSRSQTWLPIATLAAFAAVGLIDDIMDVKKIGPFGGGMKIRHKLPIYTVLAAVGAWWFFSKLGWDIIHVPGVGDFSIGIWYIPLFIFVIVATSMSVNLTDGLDGLSGGTLAAAFLAFGAIALVQGRTDLAALTAVIGGALLAFLWFNVYPARFFMGDTGSVALGATLGIIAMLTNSVLVLPIIGIIFVVETLSVIIQLTSKKIRHKKVFLSTPIHHHFEAKGWPETKVTMRFWIIAAVFAVIGTVIGIIGRGI